MDQARVFCLPSVTANNGDAEGLPIVILEAQSCGLPVITSARGGATEGIQDGETGFAHREGDVDQLTESLVHLLNDDDLACDFSISARNRALRCFDIEHCNQLLEAIYEKHSAVGIFQPRHQDE
jgi:glycosyltransferase involved in cell wall biosynthesis